eukprot:scaffold1727_cov133-Cylindrotheca_fusiformis.AAC.36
MLRSRIIFVLLASTARCDGFASPSARTQPVPSTQLNVASRKVENALASSLLAASLAISASHPLPAQAYSESDYASETVQEVIATLKKNQGNVDGTFQAFETMAEIISEGKGVGGMVNYKGIQLERGYIADEDTSIYNPGLSLLTESEKERLVAAAADSRRAGITQGQWDENIENAFQELRGKLDPFHMTELSGFLQFVPVYGAILYLAVLAVQQFLRDLFPIAYGVGILAFLIPIFGLVAAGPQ